MRRFEAAKACRGVAGNLQSCARSLGRRSTPTDSRQAAVRIEALPTMHEIFRRGREASSCTWTDLEMRSFVALGHCPPGWLRESTRPRWLGTVPHHLSVREPPKISGSTDGATFHSSLLCAAKGSAAFLLNCCDHLQAVLRRQAGAWCHDPVANHGWN